MADTGMPNEKAVSADGPASVYLTPALEQWRHHTDGPLIAIALASLPLLALELARSELTTGDELFLDIINGIVFVAFLADYLVELYLSSNRAAFMRHEWIAAILVVTQGLAIVPSLS